MRAWTLGERGQNNSIPPSADAEILDFVYMDDVVRRHARVVSRLGCVTFRV